MDQSLSRRRFVGSAAAVGIGLSLPTVGVGAEKERPALLGGKRVRTQGYPSWPHVGDREEKAVAEVVRSGHWYRSRMVEQFEEEYARLNGAKYCVAVSSGTSALYSSLAALGVGPGDEVILPPYTFVATVNVVTLHYAMPVFVDSDRETFLMDPRKLEAAITERTAAIIPVHIGGTPADLDSILAIARKHKIPVIEDACQAHLGQWRSRSVGTWGTSGCFSFQLSKNLPSGEGGAILTQDETMANNCFAFHNCGRRRDKADAKYSYKNGFATNLRMTELQAALLLSQLVGLEDRAKTRHENALYLSGMLREIPGLTPGRLYEGCTRSAYHLYMFRYDAEKFGLPRNKFIKAMTAEGIPCSAGYGPLNKASFLSDTIKSRPYVRVYGQKAIDSWEQRNACPENDKLCREALWFSQNLLLGPRSDMDQIIAAIRKIHAHAAELAKA